MSGVTTAKGHILGEYMLYYFVFFRLTVMQQFKWIRIYIKKDHTQLNVHAKLSL